MERKLSINGWLLLITHVLGFPWYWYCFRDYRPSFKVSCPYSIVGVIWTLTSKQQHYPNTLPAAPRVPKRCSNPSIALAQCCLISVFKWKLYPTYHGCSLRSLIWHQYLWSKGVHWSIRYLKRELTSYSAFSQESKLCRSASLSSFFFHLETRRLLSNQASHPVQVSATEQGLFDSSFLIYFIQEVCLYQQPILLQGYLAVRQYD